MFKRIKVRQESNQHLVQFDATKPVLIATNGVLTLIVLSVMLNIVLLGFLLLT